MDYLSGLNERQLEAVERTEGPLLVLAGAGTGKTKVLTHRIAHIINLGLAQGSGILAVTFTNKASKEMQSRIANLTNANGLTLGTFHSIAARILRQYSQHFDLSHNFTIIDSDDQLKLVKTLLLEKGLDAKQDAKSVLGIISRWKDAGLLPSKISDAHLQQPQIYQIAKNIYPRYQERLIHSNAVDFGDLLLYNNELILNNPDILSIFQQRFKYILIDEYQDTNAVQYSWAKSLARGHGNLCCVGDDDQSIYSWRGAEVENILRFEKDFPNSYVIKLEQNYRSTTAILKAASSVIGYNKERHGKSLWTSQRDGEKIKIVSCSTEKEEARYVASEIGSIITTKKAEAKDIAILVRAGFQTRPFEEALIASSIAFKIIGGLKFYDRMEIKDTMAYIRATINEEDDLALERIINVPRRSVGATTIASIKEYANRDNISMADAIRKMIIDGSIKNKLTAVLADLMDKFSKWRSLYKSAPPVEVTKLILEESGYIWALKLENTEESRARLENINEMLRAIADFDNIDAFVEHVSLVNDNDLDEDVKNDSVSLMTLHAAKGLEFKAVFLPGWEEGIFPHQKTINSGLPSDLEEERRIAYVGITRAKMYLYITHAENRRMFNEFITSSPSRFIAEIPSDVTITMNAAMYDTSKSYSSKSYRNSFNTLNRKVIPSSAPTVASFLKSDNTPFNPGTRISHKTFGNGIILRKNGENLEIAFDKVGVKTIKEQFVSPLM